MESLVDVREYTTDEYHEVAKLCLDIWKASDLYRGFKCSDKILHLLKRIPKDSGMLGVVAFSKGDGRPVGVILARASEFFFGPQITVADFLFWVAPEYRNLDTATKLVRYFEKWAESKGAVKVSIGTTSGIKTEKTARLFRHLGYDHAGYIFSKRMGAGYENHF